jgi:hypothetical protein
MDRAVRRTKPLVSGLLALVALAGVGCSEIDPESNVEEGGVLDSPTHEADSMRHMEERQEQNRGGGGGMGGGGRGY